MAEMKAVKDQKEKRDAPGRSGITSPYFDLASSIAVAEIIYKRGGGTATSEQLAPWLGYKSTGSGTYLTRVSAANKHFGLIDSSGDTFTITERAKKILAPVMPEDAASAKVDAFLNVQLFAKVYEQFKGGTLPPVVGLNNLFLTTYRILPDRAAQAIRVFMNSAEQAGFFSTTGDRSRLVKPSSAAVSAPAPSQRQETEAPIPVEKPRGGGGGGGDGGGVHTSLIGLLRSLPGQDESWTEKEQKRFLAAFTHTIEYLYPAKSEGQ